MFSASSIKKLILDKLGLEVLGIQENFQGCDQNVWIITTSNSNNEKIVLKHPKNEVYLRIMREVLACELFQRIAINVPRILYWDNEILIETFIVGQLLDKIKFENVSFSYNKSESVLKDISFEVDLFEISCQPNPPLICFLKAISFL